MNGSQKLFCMLLAVVALGGRVLAADGVAPVAPATPATPPAHAAGDRGPDRFKAMDTDANGSISLDEFKAAQAKRQEEMKKRMGDKFDASKLPNAEETFKKLDADANGALSPEEIKAMGGRRGPMGAGEGRKPHGEKKDAAAPADK